MCDFSLQSVRSRPAKVGDKLVTRDFGTGTRGFAAAGDPGLAVCVMPGTELAFAGEVASVSAGLLGWKTRTINHQTAIFRQVNKDKLTVHHDALEFPDGRTVLLTLLCEGQAATVLQLPARPMTAAEADDREVIVRSCRTVDGTRPKANRDAQRTDQGAYSARTEIRWQKRRAVHAKRQPGFQESLLITPSVPGGRISWRLLRCTATRGFSFAREKSRPLHKAA
jgi:hypothetical protein